MPCVLHVLYKQIQLLYYLRACSVLAGLWTCWTQDLCPTRCSAWDWARPSSWYRGCSSLVPPSPGCCFEADWACGPGRPSWIPGSERSGPEYLFLRSLPRYCRCCCCCCFGPARSNIRNRSGRCRCPSPRTQRLFGVPPSGCWSLVCSDLQRCPSPRFRCRCRNPSPAVVWVCLSMCWTCTKPTQVINYKLA